MNNLILSAFVVLAFGSIASGIRCYVCQYADVSGVGITGSTCNGPNPDASHLFNCTTDYCQTSVTRVSLVITSTTIARTCGGSAAANGVCVDSTGGNVCTYTCNTDDCNTTNGSGKVNLNFVVMLVTLIAGFLFSKF